MNYKLGSLSRKRLEGIHPDLVKVVDRAITLTPVDFRVNEGLRSEEKQRQLVRTGASQTMRSRHLTGHAVDLVALVDGKVRWDWPLYYRIAEAMRQAAIDVGVHVEWGAAWNHQVHRFASAEAASDTYVASRRKLGKRPFIDGPHWQLPWSEYPENSRG